MMLSTIIDNSKRAGGRLAERLSRPKHAVSTKVAIYRHDASEVLIMHYPKTQRNGLPGGHIELGEHPEDTLVREVEEELGVTIKNPVQRAFFRTASKGSRLVTAYTYRAPKGFAAKPPQPEFEYDTWVGKADIAAVPNMSAEYKDFVLKHWPEASA